MDKRGEMTTEQIVVLIILIASFAVILFFIFRLNLFSENSDNICHNSVIARGNIAKISSTTSNSIPLDCERSYICITTGKSCANMQKAITIKVKTKEDVYDALANELADCWWMFGEGKINYVGSDMTQKLYCSICDQIVFDESVKELFGGDTFSKNEFYEYLGKKEIVSGKSYLEYFFDTNELSLITSDKNLGQINLSKPHYVLTGITSDINSLGWFVAGGAIAGATVLSIVSGPVGWTLGAIAFVGGGLGANEFAERYVATAVKGKSGNNYISPTIIEVGSEEYNSLRCERITTKS